MPTTKEVVENVAWRQKWFRRGFIFWACLFSVGVGYSIRETRQTVNQNKSLISAIQDSRVVACNRTYESFREVLGAFFPPTPRTKKQQHDLNKFNGIIDAKKKACVHVVKQLKGESK